MRNKQRPNQPPKRSEPPRQEEGQLLYGAHIVEELLKVAPSRVERLYLAEGETERTKLWQERAEAHKIPVSYRSHDALSNLSNNGNHQGVVARCGPFAYDDWETLLDNAPQPALFLVLDSITDPQNLGAMIRSAVWFGVHGIVIPKDRASPVTPAVIRASAGAALYAKISQEVNLARVLDQLEERQIVTVGAVLEPDAVAPSKAPFTRPCALVIGAEDKGIRALLRKKCQLAVKIPGGGFESLNAAQATTVLLYEAIRQRSEKKSE